MGKRRSKKRSRRKSRRTGSSLRALLLILIILGAVVLIGDQIGLVDVDWQRVNQAVSSIGDQIGLSHIDGQELLEEALSTLEDEIQSISAPSPVPVEPVSGEWYQLYFTTPHYPDDPATRVDVIEQGLIKVINNALRSLDIAIFELDLDEVGDAILAARNRGVTVRMVTDSDSLEEDETLIRLKKEGIPIVPDERGPIMHNKFVVVDEQAVWTGSWNFTVNDTFRNNNNAIYIQSSQLAQNYAAEFEEMFSQHAFGPTSPANTPNPQIQLGDTLIETCFAPEDKCADQLIQLINQAQQNVHFMAFSFTHDGIGQAISNRAKAGVVVQGIFETRGSDTEHCELGRMQKQRLDVWQDGNPYTLHHKVFIIDDQTVVLGSFNFSNNADESNDENMLVIHNADIASQFLAEFNRVYAEAKNPPK